MITDQSISSPAQPEQPERADALDPPLLSPLLPGEEIGGFAGPEPTRYGDWEKNGRCIDF